MRFTQQKDMRDSYRSNTKKIKTKFLWWPVSIDGETRWLETATIQYRVLTENFYDYYWSPINFIDNETTTNKSTSTS